MHPLQRLPCFDKFAILENRPLWQTSLASWDRAVQQPQTITTVSASEDLVCNSVISLSFHIQISYDNRERGRGRVKRDGLSTVIKRVRARERWESARLAFTWEKCKWGERLTTHGYRRSNKRTPRLAHTLFYTHTLSLSLPLSRTHSLAWTSKRVFFQSQEVPPLHTLAAKPLSVLAQRSLNDTRVEQNRRRT